MLVGFYKKIYGWSTHIDAQLIVIPGQAEGEMYESLTSLFDCRISKFLDYSDFLILGFKVYFFVVN